MYNLDATSSIIAKTSNEGNNPASFVSIIVNIMMGNNGWKFKHKPLKMIIQFSFLQNHYSNYDKKQ